MSLRFQRKLRKNSKIAKKGLILSPKRFKAPVNGTLNLIIRNTTAFDGMLIDSIAVRRVN